MKKPEFIIIPLEDLKLDPHNPRLPGSFQTQKVNEDKILEYMLLDASLIELMMAIGENGFFPGEQLLVVKDHDGKYRVIEGNRRLSAVKLLNDPTLAKVQTVKVQKAYEEAKYHPTEIPCLIFAEESEIHNYLGYRHITGIKEWKLLEKARYLTALRKESFADLDITQASRTIAKIIGSSLDYVRRILIGFEVFKFIEDTKFFRIRDLDDTTFHFNYIADSLNKNNIREYLGVNFHSENPIEDIKSKKVENWTKWLFEKNSENITKLNGSSSDLAILNKILGNEETRTAFENGTMSFEEAADLSEDYSEIFRSSIKKSIKNLEHADGVVHKLTEFYAELSDDLTIIRKLASKIKSSKEDLEDE